MLFAALLLRCAMLFQRMLRVMRYAIHTLMRQADATPRHAMRYVYVERYVVYATCRQRLLASARAKVHTQALARYAL